MNGDDRSGDDEKTPAENDKRRSAYRSAIERALARAGKAAAEPAEAGRVRELAERSFRQRYRDPGEMRRLAAAAVATADRLSPAAGPGVLTADARIEALLALANAERVVGDYHAAEVAWRRLHELLPAGSGDALLLADAAWLEATLRTDQGRYDEALPLYRSAVRSYRACEEPDRASRALVGLARAHRGLGRWDEALGILADAARRVGARRTEGGYDPRLHLAITHNLALYLDETGHPLHALRVLEEREVDPSTRRERLLVLRGRRLEARLAANLGAREHAMAVLRELMSTYLASGLAHDAALAALELAALLADQGDHETVGRLAEEAYAIFSARSAPREAALAVLLFHRATRNRTLTTALLRGLARRLHDDRVRRRKGGGRHGA